MNRSVFNGSRSDAIELSPESPWSQSHRDVYSRSRSHSERVPDPQGDYHFTLQAHDFGKGIWNTGATRPHFHGNSSSHGMHSNEIRERSYARDLLDSLNGRRLEQGKTKDIPCKFYTRGQCRHGINCRYLHASALQTETRLSVPIAVFAHTNAQNPYHHDPPNQMRPTTPLALHTSAYVFSGYDRENLNSQGTFRTDTRDEHNGLQLNCAQRSQNNVCPSEHFGSEQPLLLFASRTSENGIYIDKGQSSHETTGSLGQPTHLVPTHLPNATAASWPWNSQMDHNNSLVHPEKQGDFVSLPFLSLQGQSISQGAYANPDISSHNGHSFNVNGQNAHHLEAVVHVVGSKETTATPKHTHGFGTQSIWNTQNFQPVGVNEPTQHQTLQEVSMAQYSISADRVGASINHNAARNEEVHIVNPYLPPLDGKALPTAAPVGKQLSRRNRDPRLVTSSSAAPQSVPPVPHEAEAISVTSAAPPSVPPIQQEAAVISSPSTTDNNTRSVQVTVDAASQRIFRTKLYKFLKEQLKKTWQSGHLTRELYKSIVHKVFQKVICSETNIHDATQKARNYFRRYRAKIIRLIKDYCDVHDVEFLE